MLVFFAALGVVWALARPYGASVDEESNYVRATGASTGDLIGKATRWPDVSLLTSPQARTVNAATRVFRVPEDVAARGSPQGGSIDSCIIFQPTHPGSCIPEATGPPLASSYQGVYPPLPYVLPGLAARAADSPVSGLLLARLASGGVCLIVLALCLWGVRDPAAPALSLLGVTVALSPTVVFFAWSMNPNGLEMVAGIAFVALCLRLARGTPPPPAAWTVTAVAGFVLGSSRPLAFVWIFFGLLVPVIVHGPSRVVSRARQGGRHAALMLAVLAVTVATTVVWNVLFNARVPGGVSAWPELVRPALSLVRGFLPEQIGIFGWGEVRLPERLYLAWQVLLLVLAAVAFVVGTWRQRLATAVLLLIYVAGILAYLRVTEAGGFPMGGRYVQPAFTAFPIVWGEVILLNRQRLFRWLRRPLVLASAAVVAVINGAALLVNGRRYSVGIDGPWSYVLDGGEWNPPGGWLPWVGLTTVGVAALVVGFAFASSTRREQGGSGQDEEAVTVTVDCPRPAPGTLSVVP